MADLGGADHAVGRRHHDDGHDEHLQREARLQPEDEEACPRRARLIDFFV